MTAVAILTEALNRGGKVVWDPPDRPRLLAPPSLHEKIRADRENVKEVLRRATVFREQAARFIREGRVIPLLALPEYPGGDGCLSCGDPVGPGHYRCELCALAARLALEGRP